MTGNDLSEAISSGQIRIVRLLLESGLPVTAAGDVRQDNIHTIAFGKQALTHTIILIDEYQTTLMTLLISFSVHGPH